MIKLTRRLQATHNHIWIFEAVDVNTEDNPPPYESKCYPDIITGGYRLKNIGTGQYIYVKNNPRRLLPFSYGDRVSFVVQSCGMITAQIYIQAALSQLPWAWRRIHTEIL